jgi:hypothetical protein
MALLWSPSPLHLHGFTALCNDQIFTSSKFKASWVASLFWVSCHEMFQGPMPDLSYKPDKPDREEHCSQEQELVHYLLHDQGLICGFASASKFLWDVSRPHAGFVIQTGQGRTLFPRTKAESTDRPEDTPCCTPRLGSNQQEHLLRVAWIFIPSASLAYATCTGSNQQEPGMLVVEQV